MKYILVTAEGEAIPFSTDLNVEEELQRANREALASQYTIASDIMFCGVKIGASYFGPHTHVFDLDTWFDMYQLR